MNKKILTTIAAFTLSGVASTGVSHAHAAGYVIDPPSRALLCKQGENKHCGNIVSYAADGITAPATSGGFPQDGQLPGGGMPEFSSLNREGATLWQKNLLNKGKAEISWQFTSPSRITDFKYYLTKPDWQDTLTEGHLTRNSFEAAPFCEKTASGQSLQGVVSHECQIPDRHGYQLIYSVAEFAKESDGTVNHLYNVVDVDIDHVNVAENAAVHSNWNKEIATIDRLIRGKPVNVAVGETVRVRFFSDKGELSTMEARITLLPGEENNWSYYVATAINQKYTDIRAGVLHADGEVYPEKGKTNSIYVHASSPLNHAETSFH